MRPTNLLQRLLPIFVSAAIAAVCVQAAHAASKPALIESRAGEPAIAAGIAYVGSADGTVYAVDLASGEERWRYAADGMVFHPPLVRDGMLLFGSQDGYLRALDLDNGRLLWEFAAGNVESVNSEGRIVGKDLETGESAYEPPGTTTNNNQ